MLTGMESELAGIDSYVTKKQGASAAIVRRRSPRDQRLRSKILHHVATLSCRLRLDVGQIVREALR
jgi:hypothetical protein